MNRRMSVFVAMIGTILLTASMRPVSSSPKISLNVTPHKTTIPLQIYDIIITTPTRAFVWNFTVDLTGKDVGSNRFNLVVDASGGTNQQVPLVLLFSDQNLTQWLSEPLATHGAQELAIAAFVPSPFFSYIAGSQTIGSAVTITFFPYGGGIYHIAILNPNVFENLTPGVQATIHAEIHGDETWTTTTIG